MSLLTSCYIFFLRDVSYQFGGAEECKQSKTREKLNVRKTIKLNRFVIGIERVAKFNCCIKEFVLNSSAIINHFQTALMLVLFTVSVHKYATKQSIYFHFASF